jgi:predicted metal-binding protein
VTQAWTEICRERMRQQREEGFGDERDDAYVRGELVRAAEAYRQHKNGLWPWGMWTLKFRSRRRDLVKAGALYLAEADRLVRAANRMKEQAREIAREVATMPEDEHAV